MNKFRIILLQIISFIKLVKRKIQNYLNVKFQLSFSYLILRLPFLTNFQKVKLCSLETLKRISDYDIKKIGIAEDKGYLALCLIKEIRADDKIMLKKLSSLISYKRYKHFDLKDLKNYLKKFKPNLIELKYFESIFVNVFAEFGDYERSEEMNLWFRKEIDYKLNRKIGIYNESSFFTSIGHMTLLVPLLKAIDLKIINKADTNIHFVITKTPISNLEYSKLLIEKCNQRGILVEEKSEFNYMDLEPNLELWPAKCIDNYIFRSHIVGLVEGCWELFNKRKFLLPNKEHIKIARKIFLESFGEIPQNFVGMHFRISKDKKSLRNTEISSAKYAINLLKSKKLKSILIGTKSNKNLYFKDSIYDFEDSPDLFDTTRLNLSRYERECLQLFVWSKSRFFIGSLSGGTEPSRTFGVPTIYLDMHPQTHERMGRNDHDHLILKRIFFEKENRFLSFDELFEEKHIASQSENADFVKSNGYRVFGCDKEKLKQSICDMILYTSGSKKTIKFNDSKKNLYIKYLKRLLEKGEIYKFKFGAKYY